MDDTTPETLPAELLRWMREQAAFPRCRLSPKAELLVCFAAAARVEEEAAAAAQPRKAGAPMPRNDAAMRSSQRALALRRSMVHFRCDNSAKV